MSGALKSASLASILIVGSILAAIAPLAAATANPSHPITWLAAGDSYASGQGLVDPSGPCARGTGKDGSGFTWALSGASTLKENGISVASGSPDLVACTGAISDQLFNADGSPNAPQWNSKKMQPFDLVTFSFGGDDIGFKATIEACTLHAHLCPPANTERNKIAAMGTTGVTLNGRHLPSYPSFLNHVAKTAVVKGGNVVVMGYPQVFENPTMWDTGRTVCSGFTFPIVNRMRGWGGDLNAIIGESVLKVDAEPASQRNDVHFTFINPVNGGGAISANDPNLLEPSTGVHHELCSKGHRPWLNGFSAKHVAHSYHPNQAGENAMGSLVAEVVPKLTWPWSPQGSSSASASQTAPCTDTAIMQAVSEYAMENGYPGTYQATGPPVCSGGWASISTEEVSNGQVLGPDTGHRVVECGCVECRVFE